MSANVTCTLVNNNHDLIEILRARIVSLPSFMTPGALFV